MSRYFPILLVSRLWMLCVILTGCQSGPVEPKKYGVTGSVTMDGKPFIEDGTVYFKTIATGDINAVELRDGEFSGEATAGERRVEIVAYRLKMQDFNGMKGEVKENLIPTKYNLDSTLTAKVTPEGPNQFEFRLTSK